MLLIETLFNNTWTVSRRVRTADGQGGWVITYADIGSITGRMRPAGSAERNVADQEGRRITYVFYCLEGEDIARGDLLEGDYGDYETPLVVQVLGVREPSRADHHLEIDCEEFQSEATTGAGS